MQVGKEQQLEGDGLCDRGHCGQLPAIRSSMKEGKGSLDRRAGD